MASTNSARTLRWVLLSVFILVPLANYLSFLLPGGQDQFADDAQTRIDAAGYAFSIWGVIFLGMLAFSIVQLRGKEPMSSHLQRAIQYLIVAGIASILFVPISIGGNQILSWIDIMAHLIPLILANIALRKHVAEHPDQRVGRWTYFAPSMYLGWISAASVISTALMLDQLGVSFPPSTAKAIAVALIVVLTSLGLYLLNRSDIVYGLTVAWALVAISVEQSDSQLIQLSAWFGTVILIVMTMVGWLGKGRAFYAWD